MSRFAISQRLTSFDNRQVGIEITLAHRTHEGKQSAKGQRFRSSKKRPPTPRVSPRCLRKK